MGLNQNKRKYFLIFILIVLIGLFFRLWHVEFGLPHSFYADEPEIAELAIKYTYEFKDIVRNNNYYKLIPISYVYGTLPAYAYTLATVIFSKTSNILNISFDKTTLYIYMRTLTAFISLAVVPATTLLYLTLFKKTENRAWGAVLVAVLSALNWKLLVHAHYVNADIMLTLLLTLLYITTLKYLQNPQKSLYVWLTGILLGLSIGTKITAGITLPLFIAIFVSKKDYKSMAGFLLSAGAVFIITNPFSLIFFKDFSYRIFEMIFIEGGLVFDSVDLSPLKYLSASTYILTPLIFLYAVYGIYTVLKSDKKDSSHIFLILTVIFYLVFFSIQKRRVDRWLLPIIPIFITYGAYGITHFLQTSKFSKVGLVLVLTAVIGAYMYFPYVLLSQFQKDTPKSAAYLWSRDNLPQLSHKLAYTEEGLDPLNKLPFSKVRVIQVYTPENAHLFYPEDPLLYDYVILSSRPMTYFKKPIIDSTYPEYVSRWEMFEDTVKNPAKFKLIKTFIGTKPNLIPLSDVFIYERVN